MKLLLFRRRTLAVLACLLAATAVSRRCQRRSHPAAAAHLLCTAGSKNGRHLL